MSSTGIIAELMLYHGYDHWGFSCMGMDHDKQYLRYLGARIGAFQNVWWSMANECELANSQTFITIDAATQLRSALRVQCLMTSFAI
eukprot:COSAG02_NODE_21368_length_791_cov_0.745665_1_plen_87_part_00